MLHPNLFKYLSTHDLTQRSTLVFCPYCIRKIFQLTTSRRGRLVYVKIVYSFRSFNSRPHAEVDICIYNAVFKAIPFNSRPHAEVDTILWPVIPAGRTFNSRPHAEVDTAMVANVERLAAFNSRPHAEVDRGDERLEPCHDLSTHDLTQRST